MNLNSFVLKLDLTAFGSSITYSFFLLTTHIIIKNLNQSLLKILHIPKLKNIIHHPPQQKSPASFFRSQNYLLPDTLHIPTLNQQPLSLFRTLQNSQKNIR